MGNLVQEAAQMLSLQAFPAAREHHRAAAGHPHQPSEFAVPRFHKNANVSCDGKTGQKPRRFSSQIMGVTGVTSAPAITFFR